jgi:hypothetical protein
MTMHLPSILPPYVVEEMPTIMQAVGVVVLAVVGFVALALGALAATLCIATWRPRHPFSLPEAARTLPPSHTTTRA